MHKTLCRPRIGTGTGTGIVFHDRIVSLDCKACETHGLGIMPFILPGPANQLIVAPGYNK